MKRIGQAGHGLILVEDQRHRSDGAAVAEKFASMPWRVAMATLADLAHPYLEGFRALLAAAALLANKHPLDSAVRHQPKQRHQQVQTLGQAGREERGSDADQVHQGR